MKINGKWMTMAAALALSATLGVAGTHGAREKHHGGAKADAGLDHRIVQKLNLTEDQKKQLRDIRKSFREQNAAFFQNSRDTMKEFREAKKANDTARADALKGTLETNRELEQRLREDFKRQLLDVLTPEQRERYDALSEKRQARRDERGTQRH